MRRSREYRGLLVPSEQAVSEPWAMAETASQVRPVPGPPLEEAHLAPKEPELQRFPPRKRQ